MGKVRYGICNLIEKAKPEDMRSLVRIAAAVGFLSRICPGGAQEIGQLLGWETK